MSKGNPVYKLRVPPDLKEKLDAAGVEDVRALLSRHYLMGVSHPVVPITTKSQGVAHPKDGCDPLMVELGLLKAQQNLDAPDPTVNQPVVRKYRNVVVEPVVRKHHPRCPCDLCSVK